MPEFPKPTTVVKDVREPFYVTDAEIDAWLEYQKEFDYVRETEPNEGPEVEIFQKWCYGKKGDPWCADFQCYTWDHTWTKIPLARSGSCQTLRKRAKALGWLMPRGTTPKKGDIGLVIDTKRDHAHHIFSCSTDMKANKTFETIEGNTNPGGGREGYGVFERATRRMGGTTTYEFIRLPRKGNPRPGEPGPAVKPAPAPKPPAPAPTPAKPPAAPPAPKPSPPPRALDQEDVYHPPFWRFVVDKINPFGRR